MADSMKKNYKVSGNGILFIEKDTIVVGIEGKGEFNLAAVFSDLNNKPVKFSFSYDEDYEEPETNEDTGEILE